MLMIGVGLCLLSLLGWMASRHSAGTAGVAFDPKSAQQEAAYRGVA